MQARLQRAEALSSLDDAALKPWYLKASFQLFDATGKPSEKGVLEEWWAGPALSKITVTSPSFTGTTVVNSEGTFRNEGKERMPFLLELLERQIVHPMPQRGEVEGASLQLTQQTVGGNALDCVMLSHAVRNMPHPTLGTFPTYCMRAKDMLQVSLDFGNFMAVRSPFGVFQQRVMPIQVEITLNAIATVSAHVDVLKTMPLTAADFRVQGNMARVDAQRTHVEFEAIRATQLANQPMALPLGFRPNGHSEPIVVRVLLSTDGRVHSIRLVSTPDPILAAPAMMAVMRWTFEPYRFKEQPAEVEVEVPVSIIMTRDVTPEMKAHQRSLF
ncbi:MAG: energy transducer TonB [Acidobacteriaceae bacterium]|nr:energy transducer TonB [Acidobacteriaceae bacterium]